MSKNIAGFCRDIELGVREINTLAEAKGYFRASPRYVQLVNYLRPIYEQSTSSEEKLFIESIFIANKRDIAIHLNPEDTSDLTRVISELEKEEMATRALHAQLEYEEAKPDYDRVMKKFNIK